jgi:sulfate transport system substrate-binding protein
MWNINAIYGAALRGYTGVAKNDPAAAENFLKDVFRNVSIMDKGARESITNFERGVGDAALTYENEVLAARKAGQTYDYVVPRSTILIENPVALVDRYVDKHGVRAAAEAFIQFLFSDQAQHAFGEYGFRPIKPRLAAPAQFPAVQDLWTIAFLGGWKKVSTEIYGPQGVYTRAIEQARGAK